MKTHKGRTEIEQAAFNKQRREELARLRAEKASGIDTGNQIAEEFEANIEAEDITLPKMSLKDRMIAKFKTDDTDSKDDKKVPPQRKQKTENLISHVLPMTLSSMCAIYSQRLFKEPFKPCAPTKEEVSGILLPIFSVIGRHVEIEGRASQDALDLSTALLSSITLGTRMLMTAEEIRRDYSGQPRNRSTSGDSHREATTGATGTSTPPPDIRDFARSNGSERSVGSNGYGHDQDDPGDDRAREATYVAHLLARDFAGRQAMGLAPRGIREPLRTDLDSAHDYTIT